MHVEDREIEWEGQPLDHLSALGRRRPTQLEGTISLFLSLLLFLRAVIFADISWHRLFSLLAASSSGPTLSSSPPSLSSRPILYPRRSVSNDDRKFVVSPRADLYKGTAGAADVPVVDVNENCRLNPH